MTLVERLRNALAAAPNSMGFAEAAARELLNDAADHIEALEAEVAALRTDAERYRWLRDKASIATPHIATPDGWKHYHTGADEVVDAAIDAAIQQHAEFQP